MLKPHSFVERKRTVSTGVILPSGYKGFSMTKHKFLAQGFLSFTFLLKLSGVFPCLFSLLSEFRSVKERK